MRQEAFISDSNGLTTSALISRYLKKEIGMLNGLWTIKFRAVDDIGGGVVVINNGRVLGGDTGFTYIGNLVLEGESVRGSLRVHQFDTRLPSIIPGQSSYTLNFSGTVRGNAFALDGYVDGCTFAELKIFGQRAGSL